MCVAIISLVLYLNISASLYGSLLIIAVITIHRTRPPHFATFWPTHSPAAPAFYEITIPHPITPSRVICSANPCFIREIHPINTSTRPAFPMTTLDIVFATGARAVVTLEAGAARGEGGFGGGEVVARAAAKGVAVSGAESTYTGVGVCLRGLRGVRG